MQEIVNLLNVVSVDVQCVSGSVSKSGDPQDEAFTAGSVRYMDPKLLRPFSKARQAAARLCRTHGTRFLSGWGIPNESLDEVRQGLKVISAEVAREKAILMAELHSHRQKWEDNHPEILKYKSSFFTDAEVESSIQMLVGWYKITPLELNDPGMNDAIKVELQGMVGKVLTEIAQDVRDSWSTDAQQATTRSVGVLQRVRTKLERLAFLGGELADVAAMVESVINVLPAHGAIRGTDFVILSGLMNTLVDPSKVIAASKAMSGSNPADMWGPGLGAESAAAAPATTTTTQEEPATGGLLDGLLGGGESPAETAASSENASADAGMPGDLLAGLSAEPADVATKPGAGLGDLLSAAPDAATAPEPQEVVPAVEHAPVTDAAALARKGRPLPAALSGRKKASPTAKSDPSAAVHIPVSEKAAASALAW